MRERQKLTSAHLRCQAFVYPGQSSTHRLRTRRVHRCHYALVEGVLAMGSHAVPNCQYHCVECSPAWPSSRLNTVTSSM